MTFKCFIGCAELAHIRYVQGCTISPQVHTPLRNLHDISNILAHIYVLLNFCLGVSKHMRTTTLSSGLDYYWHIKERGR